MKKLILFALLVLGLSTSSCKDREMEYPGDCYPCNYPTDSPSDADPY